MTIRAIAQAALRWRNARRAVDRRETTNLEELYAARLALCLAVGEWEREEATPDGGQGTVGAAEGAGV